MELGNVFDERGGIAKGGAGASAAEVFGPHRTAGGILLRQVMPGVMVMGICGVWLAWAAGEGLGLFLGSLILVAVVGPALISVERNWVDRFTVAVVLVGTVGGLFLAPLFGSGSRELAMTPVQWMEAVGVVGSMTAAIVGVAGLLRRIGIPAGVAALLISAGLLVWLSWPMWMSPLLAGDAGAARAEMLGRISPIFAMNSAMKNMGEWGREAIAYRYLTNLGQDFPFSPYPSIWPDILLHLAIGGLAMGLSFVRLGPGKRE